MYLESMWVCYTSGSASHTKGGTSSPDVFSPLRVLKTTSPKAFQSTHWKEKGLFGFMSYQEEKSKI